MIISCKKFEEYLDLIFNKFGHDLDIDFDMDYVMFKKGDKEIAKIAYKEHTYKPKLTIYE